MSEFLLNVGLHTLTFTNSVEAVNIIQREASLKKVVHFNLDGSQLSLEIFNNLKEFSWEFAEHFAKVTSEGLKSIRPNSVQDYYCLNPEGHFVYFE